VQIASLDSQIKSTDAIIHLGVSDTLKAKYVKLFEELKLKHDDKVRIHSSATAKETIAISKASV